MKNLIFHMDVDSALEFFSRVRLIEAVEKKTLTEDERTDILLDMAKEGLIESVASTNRTKEQIVKDSTKHGKVLHIKSDGTKEILG